ncbi:S9 family peptidase [soil metagenome]
MSETQRTAVQPQDHFELKLPSDPQISPDGSHVAYVRTRADVQADAWFTEVCVVNTRTGERHELGKGSQPRWAPDSQSLAFLRPADAGHVIERWYCESAAREVLLTSAQEPSGLAWSPDGAQLAFIRRVLPEAPTPASGAVPPWEHLRTPQWSTPGVYTEKLVRRVEGIDADLPEGHHHIFLLTLADGAVRQLTHGPFDHGGPRVEVTKMSLGGRISWAPDGRHIVMSMQRPAAQEGPLDPKKTIAANVYEFDVADGSVRQLTEWDGPVCHATISPDGQWIAFVGFHNRRRSFHTNLLHVMPRAGGEVRALPHPDRMEVHQHIQWLPDSTGLLALVPHQGDGCLVRVGLDGAWTTLARDVGGSAASGYVMYQKGFSVARDGSVAYLRGSTQCTDEVALMGPGGTTGEVLTNESAWMAERRVAPIETMWLPVAKSGARWQAWLVRPAGVAPDEKLPMIVWLHGGPYLAWCPHFAILPQVWAARGYAVLMINPRGSLGYGEDFIDELQHDFPGADDLQIIEAVDAAVARGGIDSARVHLAGESAGGVLTAWLIGHSQRFASAAVIYGVLDWTSQVLSVDRPDYFPFYWLPGAPWEPGMHEAYWRRSPLALVDKVRTPAIVLCGERDWRTPVSQSEMYYTALKLCGVDAALVRYHDDNHSLEWHPSHWLDLIEQVDRWFRRHPVLTKDGGQVD